MEILASSPLLALFLVVALGAIVGSIPFGPLRLGAAGALFVGLVIGNFFPGLGEQMPMVQQIGLALFVYCVGLSAGQTFFTDVKKQYKLLVYTTLTLIIAAVLAVVGGRLLGLDIEMSSGVFAGSLTTTPALAAASSLTGTNTPAVGYSLGYPVGVVIGIIMVALFVNRKWPEKHDTPSLSSQKLSAVTAVVTKTIGVRDIPGWKDQHVKLSYLRSGDATMVVTPGQLLQESDQVVVVGLPKDVEKAVSALGYALPEHLADDRSKVEFKSFILSRSNLAGKTVADLNLATRFGGVVTRIRRGDLEMLAADSEILELGDQLFVVYPREEEVSISRFFGDSRNSLSQVDGIALGLGIAAGVLLGMVQVSLPHGGSFSLGTAAGPLIVGLVLGYLQRTGPVVWLLPKSANLTLRHLGLLLFLAAVGITSGPAFARTAFTSLGLRAGILALIIACTTLGLIALFGRILGLSAARTSGAMAGSLGQPALLSFAQSRVNDERIEAGYATIFAFGIVVKIVLVTVILYF